MCVNADGENACARPPYTGKGFDLGENAIRLVQLLQGAIDDPLECTLVVSRDSDASKGLPYSALSYAWRDTKKEAVTSDATPDITPTTTPITLDGIHFGVTTNLAAALKHLRQPARDVLLWIDAICINQACNEEKSHQVKRMRRIYESAEQVIIWLGPGNKHTDFSMETALKLDQRAGARKTWEHEWEKMKRLQPLCLTDKLEDLIEGLRDLLNRSWFRRVWVIQEAASSKRATIMCGDMSVSSRTFSSLPGLKGIEYDLEPHTRSVLEVMPGPLRDLSWWQKDRSLIKLLLKFQECEAEKERDKFYALFGISQDFCDATVLETDYNISMRQVEQNVI
ncbi:heterokaryon incompatibility protein-domain-containing protein, partial [Coniella lustricola]